MRVSHARILAAIERARIETRLEYRMKATSVFPPRPWARHATTPLGRAIHAHAVALPLFIEVYYHFNALTPR